MKITENDIIIFYKLKEKYDINSNVIGITGSNIKFRFIVARQARLINKKYRKLIANKDKTVYKVFDKDNREIVFVHIRTNEDLNNWKFRRFL